MGANVHKNALPSEHGCNGGARLLLPSVLTIARFFSVFDPYFEGGNLWGVRAWREFGRRTKTDGLVCVLGSGVRPRQHSKRRLYLPDS